MSKQTSAILGLFNTLNRKVLDKREQILSFEPYRKFPVSEITVAQLLDGQKGVKTMICETSRVESAGVRFRGLSLTEILELLPGKHKQPSAESVFWLLLTGEVPSYQEFDDLSSYFSSNAELPRETERLLVDLPKNIHPMTQFAIGVNSLSSFSRYEKEFFAVDKDERWKLMLEDGLFLMAKLPRMAALIYRCNFRDGKLGEMGQSDLAENFSRMIGWKDESFFEAIRLFLLIHADHEGGNVSTHASRLVASSGSNIFSSFAAGLTGLSGPIHGMGMQNCLMWLVELWKTLGDNISEETLEIYLKTYLKHNSKIPGFGHPVLNTVDERFLIQLAFAQAHQKNDPLSELILICSKTVPMVMKQMGLHPQYPNMYLHSAAILYHYGLRMYEYYCVLFGMARAIGIISNVTWDVALGMQGEEMQSVNLKDLEGLK